MLHCILDCADVCWEVQLVLSEDNISGSFHESDDVLISGTCIYTRQVIMYGLYGSYVWTCILTLDEGIPQDGSFRVHLARSSTSEDKEMECCISVETSFCHLCRISFACKAFTPSATFCQTATVACVNFWLICI